MAGAVIPIADEDVVSRLLLDPKDFDPAAVPKRVCLATHFHFNRQQEYKISVNCHRLVKNFPDDLHELGLEKEKATNERQKTGKVFTYEGFAEVLVGDIRTANDPDHKHALDVEPSPIEPTENSKGNPAHCDIVLKFEGDRPRTDIKERYVEKLIALYEAGNFTEYPKKSN